MDHKQNKINSIKVNGDDAGTLYIVATPIGNLDDITARALKILSSVDIVLAEDTRHSAPLMRHFGINAKLKAFHDHNETSQTPDIIKRLKNGDQIALISDAGTPLISDPGYGLVHAAKNEGIRVEPIPGACALIAALSASGLPTDQFLFAGFIPAKTEQRIKFLQDYQAFSGTLAFYESSHRIEKSLKACLQIFGDRQATLAREMTKKFETIKTDSIEQLIEFVSEDSNQKKGEFVVLIAGVGKQEGSGQDEELKNALNVLLSELPVSQAVDIVTKLYHVKKNPTYKLAIAMQAEQNDKEG